MAPPDCDPPEKYPPNAYGSGKHSVEPCTYSQSLVTHSNMPADVVSFPTPTSSLGTLAIYFFLFCIVAGFLYFLERLSCVIAQLQNQFIAKEDLELCPSCLYLLSAGTAGICHHIQFLRCWGQNPGLWVCWASNALTRPLIQPFYFVLTVPPTSRQEHIVSEARFKPAPCWQG